MGVIKKISNKLNLILVSLAAVCLISMLLLIIGNAFFREFFIPFKGTSEVVAWLSALTAILSVGYAQEQAAHINFDMLKEVMSSSLEKWNIVIINILSISFFSILFYYFVTYTLHLREKQALSETLAVPYYPLIFIASFGFLGLILTIVVQLIDKVRESD